MDGHRFGVRHQPPHVGENSREILAGLGYAAQEIDNLIANRAVVG